MYIKNSDKNCDPFKLFYLNLITFKNIIINIKFEYTYQR